MKKHTKIQNSTNRERIPGALQTGDCTSNKNRLMEISGTEKLNKKRMMDSDSKIIPCGWIEVILLKNYNLKIRLHDVTCKSLTFRLTDANSGIYNVITNVPIKKGDIYLTNVADNSTFKHPVLWEALKQQRMVDDENDTGYIQMTFIHYYGQDTCGVYVMQCD